MNTEKTTVTTCQMIEITDELIEALKEEGEKMKGERFEVGKSITITTSSTTKHIPGIFSCTVSTVSGTIVEETERAIKIKSCENDYGVWLPKSAIDRHYRLKKWFAPSEYQVNYFNRCNSMASKSMYTK